LSKLKSQKTNNTQISMTKIQNNWAFGNRVWFKHWDLDFGICLDFVIWNLTVNPERFIVI